MKGNTEVQKKVRKGRIDLDHVKAMDELLKFYHGKSRDIPGGIFFKVYRGARIIEQTLWGRSKGDVEKFLRFNNVRFTHVVTLGGHA